MGIYQKSLNSPGITRYVVKTGGLLGVDCTHTTIASALTDAAVATGAKEIFIKNGTYTEAVSIGADNTTLVGESMNGVIIQQLVTGAGAVIYVPNYKQFAIRTMTVKCATASASISGVYIYNNLNPGQTLYDYRIENCHFICNNFAYSDGNASLFMSVYGTATTGNIIKGVVVRGCFFESTIPHVAIGGMVITPNNQACYLHHVKIVDNYFIGKTTTDNPNTTIGDGSIVGMVGFVANNSQNGGTCTIEHIIFSGNTMECDYTPYTYCVPVCFHADNAQGGGIAIMRRYNAENNVIATYGGTNQYGIIVERQPVAGTATNDQGTVVGNTTNGPGGTNAVLNIGTCTNVVDSGNNKL